MDKIVFTDAWQKYFADFGLKTFDDFFNYSDGETVNKNNKRDVVILEKGNAPQKNRFFMKRFFHPHFKDMLFTWRNFGESCSQARCEWENTKLLSVNGIGTYKPVCYGERTKWGLECKSFIVTKELKGVPLTNYVKQNWQQLNRPQQEKIITGMAAFIRRIHENNFSLPDLYIWHIFLKENQAVGEWEFDVIDLHRMSQNVTNKKRLIENLGRLLHSMVDSYFDEDLKRLFIESYAGNDYTGDIRTLLDRVKQYSDKVSAKRKLKSY